MSKYNKNKNNSMASQRDLQNKTDQISTSN